VELAPRSAPLTLPGGNDIEDLADQLLALSEREGIDEGCEGLRLERARSARDHDRLVVGTVRRPDGDPGEVQHVEHVRVAGLVLQRDAEHVEVCDRAVALQRAQGLAALAQELLHVHPRREDALREGIVAAVDDVVEDHESQIGHPQVVDVGVGQRDAERVLFPVLGHRVELAACVARGARDAAQERPVESVHDDASPPASGASPAARRDDRA